MWVLIATLLFQRAPAIQVQEFQTKESCQYAARKFVEENDTTKDWAAERGWRKNTPGGEVYAKAICVPK